MKLLGIHTVAWIAVSLAGPAAADMIVDDCAGACEFRIWNAADLNNNGNPYFDNPSLDGSNKNIGYFLTATGGFAGNSTSPASAVPYYGAAAGTPALNYYFSPSSQSYELTLLLEVAGNKATNEFGWYLAGNRNSRTILFGGPASAGAQTSFAPAADFGFYLATGSGSIYFTESSLNGTAAAPNPAMAFQQLALFGDGSGSIWLGIEDVRNAAESSQNGSRMGDFNDMVVRVSSVSEVPEPTTVVMFGTVLVALGLVKWRKRSVSSPSNPSR
jgi:hypothetical protein